MLQLCVLRLAGDAWRNRHHPQSAFKVCTECPCTVLMAFITHDVQSAGFPAELAHIVFPFSFFSLLFCSSILIENGKWDFIIYVGNWEWATRNGVCRSQSQLENVRHSICLFLWLRRLPLFARPFLQQTAHERIEAKAYTFITHFFPQFASILEAIFIFVNLLLNLVCVVGFIFHSLCACVPASPRLATAIPHGRRHKVQTANLREHWTCSVGKSVTNSPLCASNTYEQSLFSHNNYFV